MTKGFIYILLILHCLPLFAQQGHRFNNIYPHEGSQNIRGVMTTETGYLLVSESFLDGAWRAQLIGLDRNGVQSFLKSYLFDEAGHGIGLNSIKKDSTGKIWMCGFINTGQDSTIGYIFGFSDNGDSLTLIKSSNNSQTYQDLIPLKDGFIVIGDDWENGSTSLHMSKLNEDGTEVWVKRMNNFSNKGEYGYVIRSTIDGGYVLGGIVWDYAWDTDLWVIKTDSMGNMAWNRLINNSELKDGSAAVHMGSDGFIYVGCGSGKGLNGHSQTINKNYFAKISLDNELIWEREFGPINESNPIGQLKEDRQGNIIGVTDVFFDVNGITEQGGLLLKVSPDGDSLWSETFIYNYDTSLVGRQYCWSIDTTLDGGIITGGFVQMYDTNGGQPFQDVWAVKFDSNGCFDDEYSCPVGIDEISQAEYRELKIWPNPNNGRFSIEGFLPDTEMQIIDALGRSIPFIVENSNRIKFLETKPGIYFIHVRLKGYEYCGKIIVSDE